MGQAATLAADSCHLEHISWPNPSQPRHPLSQKPLCSRNPSPRKSAVATTFETPSLEIPRVVGGFNLSHQNYIKLYNNQMG